MFVPIYLTGKLVKGCLLNLSMALLSGNITNQAEEQALCVSVCLG